MKIIHVADLHFGKAFHGLSLIRQGDQPHWKNRFLALVEQEQPDAVVIAGDVYDRAAPGNDAVELLDALLTGLAAMDVPVLMVAGNHDSGTKLAFARQLLASRNVHIAGSVAGGVLPRVTLEDAHGPVDFWLMPYVFPAAVAEVLQDDTIREYDTAVRRLLAAQPVDFGRRNVLVAHQNVLANGAKADRGGSETSVGGLGEVDYSAFDGFDYVALGHIHAAQAMGRQTVRYAGSPLCYHFDEIRKPQKGPVIVELGEKGQPVQLRTRPLEPLHTLREITGTLQEILDTEKNCRSTNEYISVKLTDPIIPPEAYATVKALVESREGSLLLSFAHARSGDPEAVSPTISDDRERPLDELFTEFYEKRANASPSQADLAVIRLIAQQLNCQDADPDEDSRQICRLLMEQEEQE